MVRVDKNLQGMNDGLARVRSRWAASLGAADGVHYRFKAPTLTTLSIC